MLTPDPKNNDRSEEPTTTRKRASEAVDPRLDEIRKLALELTAQVHEMRVQLTELTAQVQAALPAALVRLNNEAVAELIRDAPMTKLRLLSPFKANTINMPQGQELLAGDNRVRTYYRTMELGLGLQKTDVPAAEVQRILSAQAAATAAAAREAIRLAAVERAQSLHAQAAAIEASVPGA